MDKNMNKLPQTAIFTICLLLLGWPSNAAAKENASKPNRWEETIARFEADDLAHSPPKDAILFVGSSSIVRWKLPRYFPDLVTINRGFGGSQICDSTHFLDRIVLKHHPRIVVLYAGDNDIAGGKSAEQVHRDFRAFVDGVHKNLPETRIIYVGIKPSLARWKLAKQMEQANRLIAVDCRDRPNVKFIDNWQPMLADDGQPRKELFSKDGLHLSPAGYKLWTSLVRPELDATP
jgi:lysophospholipase L1-like esterase